LPHRRGTQQTHGSKLGFLWYKQQA